MSNEQLEMWPRPGEPDWGDLPDADSLTDVERALYEARAWTAWKTLDMAAPDATTTDNQDSEHRTARHVVHLAAALLYAQCRTRDRRAGFE